MEESLVEKALMDVLGRSDVDATRRLGRDEHLGLVRQLSRKDHLLNVAPGQGFQRGVLRRGLDLEILYQLLTMPLDLTKIEEACLCVRWLVVVVEYQVLCDGELLDRTVPHPLFGDVCQSSGTTFSGSPQRYVCAVQEDGAGRRRSEARNHLGELLLAVSRHTGYGENLTRAHFEVDVAKCLESAVVQRTEAAHLESSVSDHGGPSIALEYHVAPHHHLGEARSGGSSSRHGSDSAAISEHGDAVADVEDLVQLVGDEDERMTLGGHGAQCHEEVLDLLRSQDGSRLVERKERRVAIEGLDDLDTLLLSDRQLPDVGFRVDFDAVGLGELIDSFGHGLQVHEQAARRWKSQSNVLCDGDRLDQHEVLVDHPDAMGYGVGRRVDRHRLAVDENQTVVRLMEPVEDLHQGRLPRSVLAEQGVDLTSMDVEVDVIIGKHPRELLHDAAHLEVDAGRRRGGGTRLRVVTGSRRVLTHDVWCSPMGGVG
ncbi:hypothetical protein BMS3Abin02_00856 [bacterium BMS3Abin02]|nr:hypothetical protein BMS3Abin02_00856 [bacterium BMS3Abin02]